MQLWLNEGFASICGSLFAPAMLLPDTRAREAFIISEVWGALAADSRRTSHPIEVPIKDPTNVVDIFDAITYKKGASVLAMIAGWVRVHLSLVVCLHSALPRPHSVGFLFVRRLARRRSSRALVTTFANMPLKMPRRLISGKQSARRQARTWQRSLKTGRRR